MIQYNYVHILITCAFKKYNLVRWKSPHRFAEQKYNTAYTTLLWINIMPSLSPSETWNWSTNDKRGRVPPSHLNSNGIIRMVTVQYWHKNQWKYLSNLGSGVVLLVRYLALASLSCYPQTDKESLSQGPARDLCWLRRPCWQQAPVYVSPAQNNVQWCYKLNLYKIRTSIMVC